MKKKKIRIIAGYASIFFLVIALFSFSVYTFVSKTQMDKVDSDLLMYQNAVVKISGRNLDFNPLFNPNTITIIREEDGTIDFSNAPPFYFKENFNGVIEIEKNKLQTVSYKGSDFRTLSFDVLRNNKIGNVQILYNIDSDIRVLNNLKKILINGSGLVILAGFLISYFLGNFTIKPMKESIEKERAFLQDASHELRTPIAVIQSRLEGLLRTPEDRIIDRYNYIEPALRESRRISKMVTNLMILTRADAGNVEDNKEKINLYNLASDVSILYGEFAQISEKGFAFQSEENIYVMGNYEKLHQLLVILLDNALKYTGESGKINLRIYSRRDNAIIEVEDNGIGIKEENLKNVFTRFFREDKARNRSSGGTGLGLPIAKWIAESHGGNIAARKGNENGTIMEVSLPKITEKVKTRVEK